MLAAEQPVALILRHSGGVKVDGAPVRGVLRVAPGIKLEIPAGATASVVFFADNHREDITGPCRPVIQASGSQGVPASQLTRTNSRGKLALDRSMGNTQSMAGIAQRAGELSVGLWLRADGSPVVTWKPKTGTALGGGPFRVEVTALEDDMVGPAPRPLIEVADIAASQIDLGPYMSSLTPGEVYQLKVLHQGGALGGETSLIRISPQKLAEWDQLEAAAVEDSSQLGPDPLVVLTDYFAAEANVERAIRLAEKAVELTRSQGKLNPAYASLYEELLILYDRAGEIPKAEQLRTSMKACGLP
ncbi:MAG: hypothetical protein AMXMBFR33_72200 [Candidatus Xenobia bacterium]